MTEDTARKTLANTVGQETILLVEDEEVIRLMLREILTTQGYTVLDAGLAVEALALAAKQEKPINMLVTDMTMPGMNGWEMAKRLRAVNPGIPVLFISGHNDHETTLWGRMDPPVDHLFKPFSLEAFLNKLRQILDGLKTKVAGTPENPPA